MSARLFVALDVAAGDRGALAEWAREAVGDDPALRLVEPERIHLTMAFLGHRPLDEIEPLAAVTRAAAAPVGGLRTEGALWLAPRRPHVLTVGIEDGDGALAALHERVWTALEELGFERERRRFRPHLTVARVRRGAAPQTLEIPAPPARALTAETLTLYRSYLGGGGPSRYEPVERAAV